MLITIYDSVGNPKVDLSPNDSSTQVKEVQGDSVLTLSFTHYEHIELDVDDYADFQGERFWLTEKYRPRQNSKKEWVYDIKLYGVESMIKRLLVIKTVGDEENPVFTLTAPPRDHVAMIVKCMNDGMGNITDWKVGQVNGTENIVIDYFGKYCDEALKEIAEKVGAEWWVEGQTVNICKCEHGEPVELGYNKGLLSIDPGTADNVKFYTRLYPMGSSRNIDREKYGFTRLQLPGGQKYVEINADKYGRVDHFEQSAFEDIYPRRVGVVSSVRSEVKTGEDGNPFTIYYFTDNSLPFDPNDYKIGGLVIRVSFQERSELAGLGDEDNGSYYFEVNFNSSTREFEIITIWPYDNDIQLPGDKLVPKAGDKYILWNLRMPDEYYTQAEEEFLAAVNKYNADHNLDISVYKAPTDHVWIEDNNVELSIGRRVRLVSEEYFPGFGFRDSRITKITRKVNLPSSMDLEIGDALSKSSLAKISDSISDVREYAKSIGGSISLPDIIRTGDKTRPTDNNLLSALRTLATLLCKDKDDRTPYSLGVGKDLSVGGILRALGGAEFGEYLSGVFGAAVDSRGNADVESIKVRSYMQLAVLIVNRQLAIEGDVVLTESDTFESVDELDPDEAGNRRFRCRCREQWEGYFTAQYRNNVMRGIYNNITDQIAPNTPGVTHIHNAVYYTAWMRVESVGGPENNNDPNTLTVVMYPDSEVPAGVNFAPCAMMRVSRWGNAGGTEQEMMRQTCLYLSSTEGRIVKYINVTKPIIDKGNVAFCLGSIPEFLAATDGTLRAGDEAVYVQKLLAAEFREVDYFGRPRPKIRDRGEWSAAIAGAKFTDEDGTEHPDGYFNGDTRRMSTMEYERSVVGRVGCRWICCIDGTEKPPLSGGLDWALYSGDPRLRLEWAGSEDSVWADNPKLALQVLASLGSEDLTSDSRIKWRWTRRSWQGDVEQTTSDAEWNSHHTAGTNTLSLVMSDMNYSFGNPPTRLEFTVTATLTDGSGQPMKIPIDNGTGKAVMPEEAKPLSAAMTFEI